jgi:hypothetical protein
MIQSTGVDVPARVIAFLALYLAILLLIPRGRR